MFRGGWWGVTNPPGGRRDIDINQPSNVEAPKTLFGVKVTTLGQDLPKRDLCWNSHDCGLQEEADFLREKLHEAQ